MEKLANDADLRTHASPRQSAGAGQGPTKTAAIQIDHDSRLPMPGAVVTREYKGKTIEVRVLPNGFERAIHISDLQRPPRGARGRALGRTQ